MKRYLLIAVISVAGTLSFRPAVAEDPTPPATGDSAPGATQAAVCAVCHGQHGEGLAAGGNARLAGQPATYLAKQLRDFAAGTRSNTVMTPLARAQSEQAILDLSVYYSEQKAPAAARGRAATAPAGRTHGKMLANIGDARLGVQACGNCHGPNGRGEPSGLPYLAGQSAAYLSAQLEAFQKGTRKNDGGDQMADVAKRLTPADIAAVADYFSGQSPPGP